MMPLFLLLLALFVSALESVSYLGFIRNNFFIPAWFIYLFALGSMYYPFNLTKNYHAIITKFLAILSIIVTFAFFSLTLIESIQYENYIYSVLHLNLKGLEVMTVVTILSYYLFTARSHSKLKISQAGLTASLLIVLVLNLSKLTPLMLASLTPIIQDPFASYDDKMTSAYPGFYPFMLMVRSHTPEDSTIVIPPQSSPWVTEGNGNMVTRFLYPRIIIHEEDLDADHTGELYYLIAKGSWPSDGTYKHGWPKTKIPAERIWNFDLQTMSAESFDRNYDPSSDVWDWGLIKAQDE